MLVRSVAGRRRRPPALRWPEAGPPALEGGLVGEEDEERVVAGQRPDLVVEARLVDGLGDRRGGARPADEDEGQPAAGDRHRVVGEDPPQAGLVRAAAPRRPAVRVAGRTPASDPGVT